MDKEMFKEFIVIISTTFVLIILLSVFLCGGLVPLGYWLDKKFPVENKKEVEIKLEEQQLQQIISAIKGAESEVPECGK